MEYQVTSIKELSGKRRLVYINFEPAFALYPGELRKYNVVEEAIIPEETYNEIRSVLGKRATVRAMSLLKSKDYSEKELSDKLKSAYYPESAVDKAIEYVKSYGYIDDNRYAVNYLTFKASGRSRNQIMGFLHQKGISSDIIQRVCEEYYGDNSDAEYEVLLRSMRKKVEKCDEEPGYETRQKIMAHFYRKGFKAELIGKTLDIVVNEKFNNNLM